ncbi:hypothetical protein [Streptomyces sp. MOE7]|uniref:hypothetical protein n=1 Tax=Streptomyces sp. MOE7 TaxID=1961713 RepID=UPI001F402F4F|nr:hypothetical protein [Streptomyces sp. MOE7]
MDWGQRLNLSAELPNASSGATDFLPSALGLAVYNPARGAVGAPNFVPYEGKPAVAPAFTAPVDYGNRLNPTDSVNAMRFAGWYYLAVSLSPNTARYFSKGTELTLRVDVRGTAKAGPGYAEPAGTFSVTPEDQEMARNGQTAEEAAKSGTLTTVGYAGIGAGSVLLAGLGAWTLAARRSAARALAGPGVGPGGGPGTGPAPLPQATTQAAPSSSANRPTQPGRPGEQTPHQQQFRPPQGW